MSVRLHVDLPPWGVGERLNLPDGPARHVQVRRMQPGDPVQLFRGDGQVWEATIVQMGKRDVVVEVTGVRAAANHELPVAVTLACVMPANDRMDFLVEKATELGAAGLSPLQSERSVLRLSGERAERKVQHWQGIAAAACEQCGRWQLPQVSPVQTLANFLAARPWAATAKLLVLSTGDAPALQEILWPWLKQRDTSPLNEQAAACVLLSGPEGGFSPDEEAQAVAAGFERVSLGPRILRADTAPLACLAWVGLTAPAA